jgi:Abnormal spindle-like microcephaly-assoc'd, ASPM-SPD-2-Hydin
MPARTLGRRSVLMVLVMVALNVCARASGASVGYVQSSYAAPQSPQTTVSVKFNAAQALGDLNIVVVGWNNTTATVSSVADSFGNTYTRAIGPTMVSGTLSQSIYYAKSIASAAAGANTITVTFTQAANYPDIRILEYAGLNPSNPVDVTTASTGSSVSSSGAVNTTNAADLIFGANIVTGSTTGPGSGFTSHMLTSPDGDIAEDEIVASAGSYAATAPVSSGSWIMQMVAFRAGSSGTTSTLILNANPTSLNFGSIVVGQSGSHNVTFTNAGNSNVAISGVSISGPGFNASGVSSGQILAPSGAATLAVTFTPWATGSASGTVTVTSNASNSPAKITLTGAGASHSVLLAWNASSGSVSGYNIYRSTVSGSGYTKLNSSLISQTTYTDAIVQAGTTYYYVATGVSTSAQESAYSKQVAAVIP